MSTQVFKRRELKYLMTNEQAMLLRKIMTQYMKPDQYFKSSIRNLYYDTPSYLLIRRSIEKPEYKEKIRIRCYQTIKNEDLVFVELKKKYKSTVFKRRTTLKYVDAIKLMNKEEVILNNQIEKEIKYFIDYYKNLKPSIFLSYERESYINKEKEYLRITIDKEIIFREYDLDLTKDKYGENILPDNKVLVEIKTNFGYPSWLVDFLSENKIYKQSFSKYGNVYQRIINKNKIEKERKYEYIN